MCRKDNVMESESRAVQENMDYGFHFGKAQESSGYDVDCKKRGWEGLDNLR